MTSHSRILYWEFLVHIIFIANCLYKYLPNFPMHINRIGGVMVIVLASSAVGRGFEPQFGQTKDYKICICCFSAKHAAKTGWFGIRIMCPRGVTCLPADCCFSQLAD